MKSTMTLEDVRKSNLDRDKFARGIASALGIEQDAGQVLKLTELDVLRRGLQHKDLKVSFEIAANDKEESTTIANMLVRESWKPSAIESLQSVGMEVSAIAAINAEVKSLDDPDETPAPPSPPRGMPKGVVVAITIACICVSALIGYLTYLLAWTSRRDTSSSDGEWADSGRMASASSMDRRYISPLAMSNTLSLATAPISTSRGHAMVLNPLASSHQVSLKDTNAEIRACALSNSQHSNGNVRQLSAVPMRLVENDEPFYGGL